MPRINESHHRHLLHAWHETGGGDIAFGDDKRDFVAGTDAKLACEITPENNAETACLEIVDRTHADGRRDVAHRRFGCRINAANHSALNARAGRKQSLAGDKRRACDDAAFGGFKRAECVLPVADTAREVIDLGMGQHGEHAVAYFLLKAVHHRKHDDECHDAQGDGSDRNARNKAHETVFATAASTGSRVAQSDGNFKRKSQDVFSRIGLLF